MLNLPVVSGRGRRRQIVGSGSRVLHFIPALPVLDFFPTLSEASREKAIALHMNPSTWERIARENCALGNLGGDEMFVAAWESWLNGKSLRNLPLEFQRAHGLATDPDLSPMDGLRSAWDLLRAWAQRMVEADEQNYFDQYRLASQCYSIWRLVDYLADSEPQFKQ